VAELKINLPTATVGMQSIVIKNPKSRPFEKKIGWTAVPAITGMAAENG